MLRHVMLTGASVIAMTAAASAADMYMPGPAGPGGYKDDYVPVNTWTGFYFGANGGYGWSATGSKDLDIIFPGFPPPNSLAVGQTADPAGGFGGAQIGYNWQVSRFVLGVETDIQISAIAGTKNSVTPLGGGANFVSANSTNVDWFGTVRGRLGYSWDHFLVYATGGFAYGKVVEQQTGSLTGFGPGSFQLGQVSKSGIQTGYTLGGGVEFKPAWAFFSSPNWSVKVEYQYINLGSERATGTVFGFLPIETNAHDDAFHTVRVGLNYHIPSGYEPLK